jgi:hypothetical protein
MDFLRLSLLGGGFGLLLCAHAALLSGLCVQRPRRRALAALFVPPLVPYFGFVDGRRGWSTAWVVALLVYGLGVLATRS